MDKIKKLFKERPFLSTGFSFFLLTVFSYLVAGEDTILSTIFLMITYLIFFVWLFMYLPIKFFTNLSDIKGQSPKDKKIKVQNDKKFKVQNDKKFLKTKNFGGAFVWILFVSSMGFFLYSWIKLGIE